MLDRVLIILRFCMYQGSRYARITQGSEKNAAS